MSVQVISGTDSSVRGTYATIALAIAHASTVNGDIIKVPSGTYTGAINITKKLILEGAKSDHEVDASGRLVQTGETILLNCTISVPSNGSVIKNFGIVRTTNGNVDQLTITGTGTEATTVENCWLERYTTDSASVTARALYMTAGARAILENNTITGSITDERTVFSYKTWSHAVWFNSGGANIIAEGNTIENCRSALNIDDLSASQTIAVNGNTFKNCGTYVSFGGVNAPTGSYVFGTDSANPNTFVDPGIYNTTIINLSKCAASFRLDMRSNKYKSADSSAPKFSELDPDTLHVINARTVHMTTAKPGLVIYKAANLFVNASRSQTIAGAISYSSSNDTINIAAGTFNENVSITKPLILKGVRGEDNTSSTVIKGVNTYSIGINASNVTVQDMVIQQGSNTNFMLHVYSTPQAENITLKNIKFDATLSNARGVSLNHAKNVLIEDCDLPATQNYSLGIAGVDGLVVRNSTLRASGWGTVGIFPSEQQPTALVKNIDLSGGNTFVNGTGIGPTTSGIIQIQPTAAVPITYGLSGAVDVILPAAFINAYMIDVPASTWSTLTNNREVMRTAAVISGLRSNSSLAGIYASDLLTGETLYEDASYNLVLAATKAAATSSKIINFGAESAIPAIKSDQYAIKVGDQIRVYDLSSAAVPRELYASQVVYLMPGSVSSGVPLVAVSAMALSSTPYLRATGAGTGVLTRTWHVITAGDLLNLGLSAPIEGVVNPLAIPTPQNITPLVQMNGVSGVSVTVSSSGGSVSSSQTDLSGVILPVAVFNQNIDVPPGQTFVIDVSGQQPIKIVEPSGVVIELVVKDPANVDATFTVPVLAGQVAVQVLGPGEFIVSRKADDDNTNNVSIVFNKITYVIDDNGRVKSNTGETVALLNSNGRFTIQQPGARTTLG